MNRILFFITLLLSTFISAQTNINETNNKNPNISAIAPGGTVGSGGTITTGSSSEVGVTSGELSVSLTGAANYNIPLTLPSGINGVMPQISLNYNSQSGVGLAGYGWNISGLSSITRIASTKFHDNEIDPVDFDSSDRFALDGQRLIIKSGTYGVAGSTYQTENFSNIKVSLILDYFKVEYPDGTSAFYGYSVDSKIGTLTYAITYWENPQGVRINYAYNSTNNVLYINSIKYGSIGITTQINEINFIYKNKIKKEDSFINGLSIISDKILSEINIKSNSIGYRNYLLLHDNILNYERLISVTEKDGNKTKSYNPTVFTYQETITNNTISVASSTILTNASFGSDYFGPINGDFDGNGDIDLITASLPTITQFTGINDMTSSSTGVVSTLSLLPNYQPYKIFVAKALSGDLASGYKLKNKDNWCISGRRNVNGGNTNLAFFNIYSRESNINTSNLEYSKEFVYPSTINDIQSYLDINGDFNGDGLSDVILLPTSSNNPSKVFFVNLDKRITSNYVKDLGVTSELVINNKIIKTGDFNGDGKTDIIVFVGAPINKIYVYSLDKSDNLIKLFETNYNFTPRNTAYDYPPYHYLYGTINTELPNINLEADIALGDFNGDGKTDLFLPASTEYNPNISSDNRVIFISTGVSFVIEQFPIIYSIYKNFVTLDFDSDGKTDILGYSTGTALNDTPVSLHYFKRENNAWTNTIQTMAAPLRNQISRVRPAMFTVSKLDNDKPELVILGKDDLNNNRLYYFINQNNLSNQTLLKDITIGNGLKQTINYSSLKDGNGVYSSAGYIENYPNVDITSSLGFKLVSQIEILSSTVYKKQLYKYFGATSNIQGLGFLGFRSSLKTNWFADVTQAISSVTKYDISLRGAPIENLTTLGIVLPNLNLLSSDPFISKSYYSYNYNFLSDSYDNALLSNKVFKLRNTLIQNANGLDGTNSDITSEYDGYNNLLLKFTNLYSNTSTDSKSIQENYVYDNLPTAVPYFIGRPNKKTITAIINPNGDTTSSFELYTYNLNLLKQVNKRVTNSGVTTDYITESNDYDIYGNIIKKTLSSVNHVDRISNFQYDAATHRFLTKKIDIEGLVTDYTYNLSNGLLLTEILPSNTGFNLITTYNYDTWGKKIKTTNYLGKFETYSYSNTVDGVLKITTGAAGVDSGSKVIIDDLGRKVHEGFKTIDGRWSFTSTYYDINNKPIIISQPYFDIIGELGSFDVWNEMQYDVYGRIIQANSLKSDASSGKMTTYIYTGLSTIENDGQKTKETVKNVYGDLISLTETAIGSPITINYAYFANGNLKITTNSGVDINIEQDGWGRKKTLIDPSAGTYRYEYNNFGELKKEIVEGKGITTYNLNDFGKITSKTIVGTGSDTTNSSLSYTYNTTTKLLEGMIFNDITNNYSISYLYAYDNFKRLTSSTENRNANYEFQKQFTFDIFGRPEKERFYAKDLTTNKISDKWIKTIYKNGYKYQLYDMINSTSVGTTKLWQTNTVNQQGNVLNAIIGNGITITNTYDIFGFPTQINCNKGTTNIMTLNTIFEPVYSNLISRTSNLFGTWNETFSYDSFDRLTNYNDVNQSQLNQSYNSNGTIASNIIGSYAYSLSGKPYNVSTITPIDQSATSNVLNYYTNRKQNIGYNLFKSPVWITEEGKENIDFEYNAQNTRSVMYYGDLASTKTARIMRKFYSSDGTIEIKRKTIPTNTNEFITYIGGDGYSAPVILKYDGTTYNYFYLHRDYQGTIVAITNNTGTIVEKRLFDVWGSLIKYANNSGSVTVPTTTTGLFLDRGYTGHEHLLGVGLINMNGRIYDNKLHRFLQPDNNIQDPFNTQNYNRFGYVMNNPTKYSDPSGEYWGYLFAIANAYASGIQANNGQLNPFKWDSNGWKNAGLGLLSFYANNYVNNNTEIKTKDTFNGDILKWANDHPFVQTAWISKPPQFHVLGINMTAASEGNFVEKTLYGIANSFNIVGQYLMFRSVNDSSMRNLNGTPTTMHEGVLAFGTLPLWFVGGGEVGAVSSEIKLLQAAEEEVQYLDDLVRAAQQAYPKLAGKTQLHHIEPKYLGGAKNGALVPLDGAYHQVITNEFRSLYQYGLPKPGNTQMMDIMKQVYSKYPLPPGY